MGLKRTDEFRQDAVRIALTSGLTRKQVNEQLGRHESGTRPHSTTTRKDQTKDTRNATLASQTTRRIMQPTR
ncbi:hypothetical protein DS901_18210 [Loktanella sp. D2R18]|nr:hypothetical protein DS901_18210 [Loktanella sp. D2R18]